MGRTACTELQCLYKGDLYLLLCRLIEIVSRSASHWPRTSWMPFVMDDAFECTKLYVLKQTRVLFYARSLNCEKWLLNSSCQSIYLPIRPTVCMWLSVRIQQLGSHWKEFHEIWHLNTFHKSVDKVQFSLKSNKYDNHFLRMQNTLKTVSLWIFPRKKNYSDNSRGENQNTPFAYIFNNFSPQRSCRLWDNVEKYGRNRQSTRNNKIWRTRSACWIPKAIDTLKTILRGLSPRAN